jgi:hypothetical protein
MQAVNIHLHVHSKGTAITFFHVTRFFCPCFWSLSLILLTLKNHLCDRGYTESKLSNNIIECEIFQVLVQEAKKSYLDWGHCGGIKELYNWRHYRKCWEFNKLGEELAPCFLIITVSVHTSSELNMESLPHATPPNKASLTCAASHEPTHHSIKATMLSTLHHAHHNCLHRTRKESITTA